MDRKSFEIFAQTVKCYRVQLLTVDERPDNLAQLDFEFRKRFFKNFDYNLLFKDMTASVSPDNPIDFVDDLNIHYLILEHEPSPIKFEVAPTSEVLKNSEGCKKSEPPRTPVEPFSYMFVGPFLLHSYTMPEVEQLSKQFHLPEESQAEMYAFFNRIPVITDAMAWYSMMNYFFSLLTGRQLLITIYSYSQNVRLRRPEDSYELNPESRLSYAMIEKRYETEDAMLDAVRDGNVDEALRCSNAFYGFTLPPRVANELREGKNMAFVVQALLRKAAQSAYVHPLHIDNLSSQLAPQIENITSASQVRPFIATMIRKFCFLVRSYSRKNHSTLIRNCLDHIDFYYMEELSLNGLAKRYAVSKGYLSACFHKEMGVTVTDYINSTRVRQSIRMLNTTDLSIQAIAERCGYPDANYYARVFKKIMEKSPQQYRRDIQRL